MINVYFFIDVNAPCLDTYESQLSHVQQSIIMAVTMILVSISHSYIDRHILIYKFRHYYELVVSDK